MKKILENGIPAGNWENKYGSKNPIIKYLMNGFTNSIEKLILPKATEISSICECGCGEGKITKYVYKLLDNVEIKAFDFSQQVVDIASENNQDVNIDFYQKSIYDIDSNENADLIVCCEVLEHLEEPEKTLEKMSELNVKYYLFSVPNEPIWRVLNFIRGKYITDLGNTPGHINHWSHKTFQNMVEEHFEIILVNNPFPWSMLLAKKK